MPLTKEGCYGLAEGAPGRRVSVFYVKLTDCAARAVDTFQNTKVGGRDVEPRLKVCVCQCVCVTVHRGPLL